METATGKSDSASEQSPLTALEQALTLLPLEEKLGLMEALRAAPHLVQTESDPARFVWACRGQALSAARRLCRYWNERRKAFGERAFLPLSPSLSSYARGLTPSLSQRHPQQTTQPTTNALTEGDTAELAQGHIFSLLPNDIHGSPVLYYDKTLTVNRGILSQQAPQQLQSLALTARGASASEAASTQQNSPQQRARLLFSGCQQLVAASLSSPTTTSPSSYVFVLRVDPTESVLALRFHKAHLELGTLLAHVFPLQLKAWHVVVIWPPVPPSAPGEQSNAVSDTSAMSTWVQQALPVLLLRWEAILGRPVAHIHAGPDEATVVASLQQHGLRLLQNQSGSDSDSGSHLPPTDHVAWRSTQDSLPTARALESSPSPPTHTKTRPLEQAVKPPPKQAKRTAKSPLRNAATSTTTTSAAAPTTTTTTTTTAPMDQNWQRSTVQHAEDSGVLDDPGMQRKGLQQLAEAIRFLPDHQTAAYWQAQSTCPELVERESNPIQFLRYVYIKSHCKFILDRVLYCWHLFHI